MKAIQYLFLGSEDRTLDVTRADKESRQDSQPGVSPRRRIATRAVARLRQWRRVQREREELRQLDTRTLRDTGITRIDALRESQKPFWR